MRDALEVARGHDGQANGLAAGIWFVAGATERIDQDEDRDQGSTSAIRDFDRANVMTIHGFCQRALTEFAFDARIPFGFAVSGDDRSRGGRSRARLLAGSTSPPNPFRFWRSRRADGFRLDALSEWVGAHHAKPSVIRGVTDFVREYASANDARLKAFQAAREAWDEPEQQRRFLDALDTLTWNQNENTDRLEEVRHAFDANDPDLLPLRHAGYFGRQALSTKLSKRRVQELPNIPLYDHFEAVGTSSDKMRELWLPDKRRRVLEDARKSLRHDTWKYRRLSFNALLTELDHALAGEAGAMLAQRLRARYPVALIDEFQDTDRLQARIFETIYPSGGTACSQAAPPKGGLMIVGDPKQSIYRFRGADVFAYLGATAQRLEMRKLSLETQLPIKSRTRGGRQRGVQTRQSLPAPGTDPVRRGASRYAPLRWLANAGPGHWTPKPFQLRLFPGAAGRQAFEQGRY